MSPSSKRKEPPTSAVQSRKKQWRTPKKNQLFSQAPTINTGDAGIWATCDMHKEGKAAAELRDLFEDYATRMFGEDCLNIQPDALDAGASISVDDNNHDEPEENDESSQGAGQAMNFDIEAEIAHELHDIKETRKAQVGSKHQPLFQAVRIDVQCVIFFKTRPPVEPVSFVERICRDAKEGRGVRRSRCVKRLTPMSRMGKASWEGLDGVARDVLRDVFHGEGEKGKKFAIRPTIRNHSTMKRDEVIKQVAQAVGPSHSVNLKHYDCLVLVDIYRNILGMSVVGSDYEDLKRFNLAEIYDPTPQHQDGKVEITKTKVVAQPDQSISQVNVPANQGAVGDGDPPTTTDPGTNTLQIADARLDEVKADTSMD